MQKNSSAGDPLWTTGRPFPGRAPPADEVRRRPARDLLRVRGVARRRGRTALSLHGEAERGDAPLAVRPHHLESVEAAVAELLAAMEVVRRPQRREWKADAHLRV